jgi:nucleotide-binding universal stress UspA family protein
VFKTILVPAGGAATDLPVFETALAVARMSHAHLVFLHVRVDVRDIIASMAAGDLGAGGGMGEWIDDMEADAARLQADTKTAVEAFCASKQIPMTDLPEVGTSAAPGGTAEWRTEISRLSDCVSAYARVADLMVAGRSPSRAGVGGEVLEAGLMGSGRPLLIAAAKAPDALGGTVAIAWKDAPEAARAVSAAMPFIGTAARVLIVSVQEHGGRPDKSCDRLLGMLRWHNPNVSVVRLETQNDAPVEVLLAEVVKSGAGLLVMGGYGHSRLREAVFGGFTQRILDGAAIPVLMAH